MRSGYRSPGLVEAAVCTVKPFGPVPTQMVLVAAGAVTLLFADFNGAAVLLRWVICLAIVGVTYVLFAWTAIITFNEARMQVTVQHALLPFKGRVRVYDLATTSDARLVAAGSTVRFEILNDREIVVDAIVVRRTDTREWEFVQRVVAAVGSCDSVDEAS